MIKAIRSFFGFWYGFIVGDDWTVAAAIGVALVITEALNQRGVVAWWLLPLTVVVATAASLWRTGGAGPTKAPG
jgi:hypothetical protein